MDIRALRYFLAAAETENLTRAAERLNVVQSALSHQVRALETELGTDLFERRGRRLRLSPIGQMFREEAARVVATLEGARERVRRASNGDLGTLRIGFQSVACRNPLVSESLLVFRERFPGVEVKLSSVTGAALLDGIRAGTYDAGFLHVPIAFPDLKTILFETADWLLALPRNHPLCRKRRIRLADLQGEPFIWLPRDIAPVLHDRMIALCHAGGLSPRIVQEAFDEMMMVNLVAVGMGLSFVVDTAKESWPENMVVFRRVEDFSLPLPLCFVWPAQTPAPALARLIDTVRERRQQGRRGKAG
jgi:DNA-binding transcriptional LysR family regulator